MVDRKLVTLGFIDDGFRKLNLRSCDGDKPSPLTGISLTTNDSNLHQHGKLFANANACKHCTCSLGMIYIYVHVYSLSRSMV